MVPHAAPAAARGPEDGGRVRAPTLRGWAWIIASLALTSLAALGVVSVVALVPHAQMVRQAAAPILPLYSAASEQERALRDELAAAYRWVGSNNPAALAELRALLARAAPAEDPRLKAAISPRFRSRLAHADSLVVAATARITAAVAAYRPGRTERSLALLALAGADRQRIASEMEALATASVEDARAAQESAVAAAERARLVIVLSALAAIALVVASLTLLRRRVVLPIARLHADVRAIAAGDLAHRAAVGAPDEIGELAQDVNLMTAALEARLRQQDRLTAVGELAAGLAHELNNPLQVILAQASQCDPGGPRQETAETLRLIQEHARRAGRVVQGVLSFVRARSGERKAEDVNAVVGRTLDLLGNEFAAEEVRLAPRLSPRLPAVLMDAEQIEQVVVNLLANALRAAASGAEARRVLVETYAESDTVVVAVHDSGPGVPEELRTRIFEPFFSAEGRPGSLGLSVAAQIVRGHGGALTVGRSTVGGARFEMRLPAAASPGPAAQTVKPPAAGAPLADPQTAAAVAPSRGELEGLRLLVADDEDAVRTTWTRYFTRLGASVTPAGDGVEALDQIRHHDFDAIVLDLKMPRLGGWEVVQAARQERPDLAGRIVVVSGDITGLLELGTAENLQPWRLLEKPAELDTIRAAVLRASKQ